MYARDDYFAYGTDGKEMPLVAIGRLPCRETEEVRHFVDKVLEFEKSPISQDTSWLKRAVLIGADGFTRLADQAESATPLKDWKLEKIYAQEDSVAANGPLQASIVESISQGAAAVFFVGHGSGLRWRTGPVDVKKQTDMFSKEHMDKLTNKGRYPVAFASTCYSSMFDNPALHSGAEAGIGVYMVLAEGKGAIACIAHVGKVSVSSSNMFLVRVMNELYAKAVPRLGDAFITVKRQLHTGEFAGMAMIGDPATYFGTRYASSSSSSSTKVSP